LSSAVTSTPSSRSWSARFQGPSRTHFWQPWLTHVVRWREYAELLRRFDADHQAMAAIVLRHGLELRLGPFRLSRLPSNDAVEVGSMLARLRAAAPT
jgi:hypothetical protein